MTSSTLPYLANQTKQELANIDLVMEYMSIAYDPKRASGKAVAHLCATGNRFIGSTTFPNARTLEEYADAHAQIMKQVNNLRFVSFDIVFAKDDRVCLRYTAEGSHSGEPHGEIKATGRKAQWTASALFRISDGKLIEFIKEWNKLPMWEQLGWPIEECLTQR
jgi:predicted ester cyclase